MSETTDFQDAEGKIKDILRGLESKHDRSIWGVDVVQEQGFKRKIRSIQIRIETYSYPMAEVI